MTNNETNEAVAKRLGLALVLYASYYEWHDGKKYFEPATDPAAALWALERYGRCTKIIRFEPSHVCEGSWTCSVHPAKPSGQGGTLCQAICAAILEAGG